MPTIEIQVTTADGELESRPVAAVATRTPGLLATPALFHTPGYTGWWTLTHAPSGCHLPTYFPTADQAVKFADDLAGLADWTRPGEDIKNRLKQGEARDRYRSAMAHHDGLARGDLEPDVACDAAMLHTAQSRVAAAEEALDQAKRAQSAAVSDELAAIGGDHEAWLRIVAAFTARGAR